MSQRIPIYIPTFISDQNYNPNRVLPRLFFFNGMVECEEYYIESGSLTNSGVVKAVTQFPYFDHYNVVTGSFPTTGSRSLLFNNEAPVYGQQPNETLFTDYWSNYVELLYNPKTRLINVSAIIPLADYFDMELNDVINWRGDYYHLRALNEYSLKTGEVKVQLLGPLLAGALDGFTPPAPVTSSFSYVSWSLVEGGADANLKITDNGASEVNATTNSSGSFIVDATNTISASIEGISWPEFGPVTMSLIVSSSEFNSTQTSLTQSNGLNVNFTGSENVTYYITGSTTYTSFDGINFNITGACNGTDAEVTMSGATGGSGVYEFNTIAYLTSEGASSATTNYVETSSVNFINQPDGTYYFVVRDKNYPSNKVVKFYTNNCNGSGSAPTGSTSTASGVFGYMEPCIGGTIDDFMGASVYLTSEVDVDTEFIVNVSHIDIGASCGSGESTNTFYVTVPSGSTTSVFNACSNGAYYPSGRTICSACISSCDNPLVFISSSVSC
jgi:hypothetical protein